jgi:Ni2+-binding GTPase involved in maturation of urease and hydrogenase
MFLAANVVAINKVDLAKAMEVEPERLRSDVARLNVSAVTVPTSCKNGTGIDEVIMGLGLG